MFVLRNDSLSRRHGARWLPDDGGTHLVNRTGTCKLWKNVSVSGVHLARCEKLCVCFVFLFFILLPRSEEIPERPLK